MDKHLQECGDSVQAMSGSRGAVRQGLHPEDDGVGEELQVAAAGAGAMPRVREGLGKGVTGDALQNPARHG